jgi:hypothetical protein
MPSAPPLYEAEAKLWVYAMQNQSTKIVFDEVAEIFEFLGK